MLSVGDALAVALLLLFSVWFGGQIAALVAI